MSLTATETKLATAVETHRPSFSMGNRSCYLILLAVCFFLYFVGLNTFPIIDPSEGYYVSACREMLDLGDYITPHLNYQIYFSKPIINFWLIAASYKLFGLSEFSARLPFAVLSTLLVLATYWYGKRLISQGAGFIGAFCLATAPLLLLESRKSSIDITFTFFVDIAVFATALVLSKPGRWTWLMVYLALALGVLTKGPAALVLYGAGMAVFLVVARPSLSSLKNWVSAMKPIAGILAFIAVLLPWCIAVSIATDGLFLKVFVIYENLARFQGKTNLGQVKLWYYLPTLAYGFAPWIFLLPRAVYQPFFQNRKAGVGFRERIATDARVRTLVLLSSWSLATFVFFSISKTQLATYILPIIAPLALLTGTLVDEWLSKGLNSVSRASRNWAKAFSWSFALVGFMSVPAAIVFLTMWKAAPPMVQALILGAGFILAAGTAMQLVEFSKGRLVGCLKWVGITVTVVLAIGTPLTFYLTVNQIQGDLKTIAINAGKSNDKLAMYGNFMPSALFYARKPITAFFHDHQLKPCKAPPDLSMYGTYPYIPQSVIVHEDQYELFRKSVDCDLELVEARGPWRWYRTPGFELEETLTLEETFRIPGALNEILSGKAQTGPLAVPYGTGKIYGIRAQEAKRQRLEARQ